jgi:hypothetical protein
LRNASKTVAEASHDSRSTSTTVAEAIRSSGARLRRSKRRPQRWRGARTTPEGAPRAARAVEGPSPLTARSGGGPRGPRGRAAPAAEAAEGSAQTTRADLRPKENYQSESKSGSPHKSVDPAALRLLSQGPRAHGGAATACGLLTIASTGQRP